MRLEKEKVRSGKLYRIGYIPYLNKYVLANVVCWIAWYDRFYEISETEYLLYKTDLAKLDALAAELVDPCCGSERFLFSEKKEENTAERSELLQKCMKSLKNVNEDYERI